MSVLLDVADILLSLVLVLTPPGSFLVVPVLHSVGYISKRWCHLHFLEKLRKSKVIPVGTTCLLAITCKRI